MFSTTFSQYHFAHATFQAFFTAKYFEKLPDQGIDIILSHISDRWWDDVFLLYVDKQGIPKQDLMRVKGDASIYRVYPRLLMERGNYQAAANVYEALANDFEANKDLPAAIRSLRNVLRIDSTRADVEKRIQSLCGKTESRSLTMLAVVTLIVIVLAILIIVVIGRLG